MSEAVSYRQRVCQMSKSAAISLLPHSLRFPYQGMDRSLITTQMAFVLGLAVTDQEEGRRGAGGVCF